MISFVHYTFLISNVIMHSLYFYYNPKANDVYFKFGKLFLLTLLICKFFIGHYKGFRFFSFKILLALFFEFLQSIFNNFYLSNNFSILIPFFITVFLFFIAFLENVREIKSFHKISWIFYAFFIVIFIIQAIALYFAIFIYITEFQLELCILSIFIINCTALSVFRMAKTTNMSFINGVIAMTLYNAYYLVFVYSELIIENNQHIIILKGFVNIFYFSSLYLISCCSIDHNEFLIATEFKTKKD